MPHIFNLFDCPILVHSFQKFEFKMIHRIIFACMIQCLPIVLKGPVFWPSILTFLYHADRRKWPFCTGTCGQHPSNNHWLFLIHTFVNVVK